MWKARIPLWVVCSQSAVFLLCFKGDSSDVLAPLTPRTPRFGSTQGDLWVIIKGMADSAVTVGLLTTASLAKPAFLKAWVKSGENVWGNTSHREFGGIIGQTFGIEALTQQHGSPLHSMCATLNAMSFLF